MANGKSTGAGSRKRGGRKARPRGPHSSGALEAGAADDSAASEHAPEAAATEADSSGKVSIPSTGSAGKQAQQLFTVGTFDEEDHGGALPAGSRATEPGLPANAVLRSSREPRKPMFTMGSHSEASDIDAPADSKAEGEGAGPAPAGGSHLHACKATTGLSRLGHSEPAACDGEHVHEGRLASAPLEASERAQRGRSRTAQSREAHGKMRKKVASKKSHVKKATSSAALRSRTRPNAALRRESQPHEHSRDSAGDSSYVDYSDDGAGPAAGPARSQHSSTATLGDAEDSATTASMDSPRPELQSRQDPEPPQPDPGPRTQRRDEQAGAFVAKSIKRNMESQRQQVLVEQEEEDMEITCALLTGMPRRRNRPPGMAPHAFLAPDTHAYGLQIHRSERAYAHVRATAHPLLRCISRCVSLRELRAAASEMPRSRRPPLEPRSHARAEWWEALMPPSPSRAAELPSWALPLDSAKCAVYDAQTHDPACGHVRELRARAADLRIARQHPASATRPASGETWHGRRVPGLLSVRSFPVPLNLAATRSDTDLWASSPDSAGVPRSNPLAPPYRRYGTVYGHTSANPANGPSGFLINGSALRRQDSLHQTSHPNTASILENDPRRSSYFDRLSIEEDRPQPAASATQPNPVALLRRVISGWTGGNTSFGSSQ